MSRFISRAVVYKAAMLLLSCLFVLSLTANNFASSEGGAMISGIPSGHEVSLPGMFNIDKWMLQSDGHTVADYLGQKYDGKTRQEMINMVFADPHATSASDAQSRFAQGLKAVGYKPRILHTGGYTGRIESELYQQQPDKPKKGAFADKPWFFTNIHHLRAFGPYYHNGAYYTIVASSTESFSLFKLTHVFSSFNTTRDDLSAKLVKVGYERLPDLNLQNQISAADRTLSTVDFDGVSAYLQMPKIISK
jgi:hypothetical protein